MAKWVIDKAHSEIGFEVRHMMVSKVRGRFNSYEAEIEADDLTNPTNASISFTFDVASIDTKLEDRDNHLKSADFFDVEKYPTITFKSTNIQKKDDNVFEVTGDLTIKDVTKPVTFEVEFNGKGKNPWGVEVYGFEAHAKINREDFGLTWNAALETGGVLVGKEVKIIAELEVNPGN
ncbi:YceI family protein [Ureibacillus sp. FSL K6-8385]|uniref:YceI family protein n=1 Tax=Ureibacillus terrenus TaxID=118246 RepID=A0A540V5J3_9BACL|nr:YceI family protein [Ureibacillus terrenus]MED3661220.1 YceI family protein [Ureibacillus terrenus]MED3764305.1 YceI family protein [Ureibacillus terrenus]TQE92012.1 YceI family protein [Ureibacillus terrenus]